MAEQNPQSTDPEQAQEGAENSLLGNPDEATGGPEERASDMLERESDEEQGS
ncbi:MAG TPA: hypothetical protein VD931_20465 [Baekduia sp.]|nr:hypothetical protein [Baekduia sp.]